MRFQYMTARLELKILDAQDASLVLDFYYKNCGHFKPWEPLHPSDFYSLDYQRSSLIAEMNQFLDSLSVRYYLFTQEDPFHIIGTINFYQIKRGYEGSCKLGYKLDKDFMKKGYAKEALCFLLPKIIEHYHLYRLEADIMPSNLQSIHFIEKLGFACEGISRKCYEIAGTREDHLRYSILLPEVYASISAFSSTRITF